MLVIIGKTWRLNGTLLPQRTPKCPKKLAWTRFPAAAAWPVDRRPDGSSLSCHFHPLSSKRVQTQHFSWCETTEASTSAAVVRLHKGSRLKRKILLCRPRYNRWLLELLPWVIEQSSLLNGWPRSLHETLSGISNKQYVCKVWIHYCI